MNQIESPPTDEIGRLQRLYELSMLLSGDPMDVFVHIARMIGELLDVKIVCLSEIRGHELHFLSVYNQGEVFTDSGCCRLDITPCATVEESKDLRIYDHVAEHFPEAVFLKQHNAFSYCGFPALDNNGTVVAVTCLLDDRPHEYSRRDQELLRILGQRIGLEIERKRLDEARQAALQANKKSEQRFQDIARAAAEFIWEVDREGRFTYLADRVVETHGYPVSEILGKTIFDFQFPEDIARTRDQFSALVEAGKPFRDFEYRVRSSTGEDVWLNTRGVPIFDGQGNLEGFRGTSSNITERKQADQLLRLSEQRLELAMMGADLGLWDWNMETGVVFFDDRWASMLGYNQEEIFPRYDGWARLVHPEDLPRVREILDAHLRGNTPFYEVEHRLRTKSGEWKWVLSRGKVIERDMNGTPRRAAGTHMDISTRKDLEDLLRQQQDALSMAQRVTTAGELSATMAHELNQPLAAIENYVGAALLGYSGVLSAHPELKQILDETLRLTRRAAEVVMGIRNLFRKRELNKEWLDLNAFMEGTLLLVSAELIRRRIKLVKKIRLPLPSIWGDRVLLQQLFLNLMRNAMEAMDQVEPGRRILTLRAMASGNRGIVISIGDTGPGITPEAQARIFEPFVTTKQNGIGLGLSICRTIVQAHNGQLSAQSNAGQGASFDLVLPIDQGEERNERQPTSILS